MQFTLVVNPSHPFLAMLVPVIVEARPQRCVDERCLVVDRRSTDPSTPCRSASPHQLPPRTSKTRLDGTYQKLESVPSGVAGEYSALVHGSVQTYRSVLLVRRRLAILDDFRHYRLRLSTSTPRRAVAHAASRMEPERDMHLACVRYLPSTILTTHRIDGGRRNGEKGKAGPRSGRKVIYFMLGNDAGDARKRRALRQRRRSATCGSRAFDTSRRRH